MTFAAAPPPARYLLVVLVLVLAACADADPDADAAVLASEAVPFPDLAATADADDPSGAPDGD